MKIKQSLQLYSGGKKAYQKALLKENKTKSLKGISKKSLLKKLKDSEYFNF
ncbi:hypothetical protein [Polaribacter sp.]|uniref:hypothetical protein n=1 Tax=Polaribacter sp. TaxID=1920175 RepID=UPI003F6BF6FF